MRTGRVAGMECAIRWDHPQRGRLHGVAFGKNAGRTYDDAVITAAVAFARAIGAQTVVEGIETIALRDRARELGCDIGQGYLWSRQVTADEFPSTVRAIRVDGALA